MSKSDDNKKRIDYLLVALIFLLMIVITFINVLGRYIFHYSFAFSEEVTINVFVWLTVIGSGIAFERGAHLGVNTFYRYFPGKIKLFIAYFNAFLASLLYIIVNLILIKSIYMEYNFFHTRSVGLNIPVWIYYVGVVISSVFVFAGILRGLKKKVKKDFSVSKSK